MKKYRHAVSALVLKSTDLCSPSGCSTLDQILIVHKPRTYDTWQLPQGGVEEGETIEQAAIRELHEETNVSLQKALHVSEERYCYDFPPEFIARHKPMNDGQCLSFVVFRAPQDTVVTVDNHEIDDYLWVLPEQLHSYLPRKAYLEVVQKVLTAVSLESK